MKSCFMSDCKAEHLGPHFDACWSCRSMLEKRVWHYYGLSFIKTSSMNLFSPCMHLGLPVVKNLNYHQIPSSWFETWFRQQMKENVSIIHHHYLPFCTCESVKWTVMMHFIVGPFFILHPSLYMNHLLSSTI